MNRIGGKSNTGEGGEDPARYRNELKGIKAVLASEEEQWKKVGEQVRKVRDTFGPKTPLGKRRR